jgi:hypothetical protein
MLFLEKAGFEPYNLLAATETTHNLAKVLSRAGPAVQIGLRKRLKQVCWTCGVAGLAYSGLQAPHRRKGALPELLPHTSQQTTIMLQQLDYRMHPVKKRYGHQIGSRLLFLGDKQGTYAVSSSKPCRLTGALQTTVKTLQA